MEWTEHVARVGQVRSALKLQSENLKRREFARPRRILDDNI